MPVMARHFALVDFKIRDRSLKVWVPVHEPLVAIDQALLVELDKDLRHRAHHIVVGIVAVAHREGFL